MREAQSRGLELFRVDNFTAMAGSGIEANVMPTDNSSPVPILIGNRRLMDERGISLANFQDDSERLAGEGKTPVYVSLNGKLAGIVALADVVKKNSRKAIERLHDMGIETVMITGDNKRTAEAIASQVGIDNVLSEVLPQDKSAEIKKLQNPVTDNQPGEKRKLFKTLFSQAINRSSVEPGEKQKFFSQAINRRFIAMAGDGINDAPALAQADIGIAIGSGTDVAIESADIVLMHSDLMDVPRAIYLSKRTIRTIKQNLFWAFGYNVLGIPIAAGLLYLFGGPLLNPMFAAAAMSMSSVSVLTNALRLKSVKLSLG